MMVMSYHVNLVLRVLLIGASVLVTFADVFVNKYSRMVIVKGKSYGGRRKDIYTRQDVYLPALTAKEKCEDKSEYCWQYIQYCQTHRQSLEGRCDKTCKYCNLKNEIKECKDLRSDCRQILWYCPAMRGVCDKTCGFCGTPKCEDKRVDCSHLKEPYCKSHKKRMKKVCAKTCELCKDGNNPFSKKGKTEGNSSRKYARSPEDGFVSAHMPEPIFQDILMPALIAEGSGCGDTVDYCWHYVQYCKTHRKSLEGKCDKTCGYCKYLGPLEECVDRRSDCVGVLYYCPVLKGQCDKTCGYCGTPKCEDKRVDCSFLKVPYCRSHKKRMKKVCAKTCRLCGSLKKEDRSALPALLPPSIFHDVFLPANTQPVVSRDIFLPAKSPGSCRDTMEECWHYTQYCKTHRKSLEGRCDKTCNYCGSGRITECVDRRSDCYGILYYCPQLRGQCDQTCGFCGSNQCIDRRPDCPDLRDAYCKSHPKRMRQVCAKTCGYCGQCTDNYPSDKCFWLKKWGKCNTDLRMHDNCHQTCGFCQLPEPHQCWNSKYGCCWNKKARKKDKLGTNCKPCRDRYKRLCKNLKKACVQNEWVRTHCPITCDYCPKKGATCNDDPERTHLCQFWKKEFNFCSKDPDVMTHFCPHTCNIDCKGR